MRKRHAAAVVGLVVSVYAAGCSLLLDTSSLGGAPSSDAASDANDASTASDASDAADASPTSDGGAPCDATFCDDFDRTPLGATWTAQEVSNGGIIELGAPALSPPNALRARFATATTKLDRAALLERDLGAGSRLRCDFSIFVESPPKVDFIDLLRIRTTAPGSSDYVLWFGIGASSGATFREDVFLSDGGCPGCPRKETSPPALPVSQWVRVTVETDFATATLSYDGAVVSGGAFGGFKPATNLRVAVGSVAYVQQSSAVLIDDFACSTAQ